MFTVTGLFLPEQVMPRPAHNQDREEPKRGLCLLASLLAPGPAALSLGIILVQVALHTVSEVTNIANHRLGEGLFQQGELQAQCQHPSLAN